MDLRLMSNEARQPFARKPSGRRVFWLRPALAGIRSHSPLRGCSGLAALAAAKIPRRRTPRNFKTGSQTPCEALLESRESG